MNMALFGYRQFAMGSMVAFIYGTALFGSTYLLPVYMQVGLHLSASHVGTILLPAGIVLALTIRLVGRLADRQPTWLLVCTGLVLLALSFALMLTLSPRQRAVVAGGLCDRRAASGWASSCLRSISARCGRSPSR